MSLSDPYLPLRALSSYSGMSVRKLRAMLRHPTHPLPHYRVNGKIIVRQSDFDGWIATYRRRGLADVDAAVNEILAALRIA